MKEQIIICMPLKNAGKTVGRSIQSIINQENTKRNIILLIGNDNSTDNSMEMIQSFLPNPNIQLLNLDFGKAYMARNYLNDYVRKNFSDCVLIGRLDADDVLFDDNTISKVEKIFDNTNFDVLFAGNQQISNGDLLKWENLAQKELLDKEYLLQRLFDMAKGNPKAELPSCNTFIKPAVNVQYPFVESAEDHWFTVLLLLEKDKYKIHIEEKLIYCSYSLNGNMTLKNKKENYHSESRKELYNYALRKINNMH